MAMTKSNLFPWLVPFAFVAAVTTSTGFANAEPVSETTQASEGPPAEAIVRFNRALKLFEEGDDAAALVEFRRAHQLAPSYKLHYNIAQVCFELHDYVSALRSLRAYMTEGGDEIPADRRAVVERDLERAASRVTTVVLSTSVEGADIKVDGIPVTATSHRVLVNAGQRRITAEKDGFVGVTEMIQASGGETVRVALVLKPSVRSQEAASPGSAPETPSRFTKASWLGLASGGVLLAGAGAFGLASNSAAANVREARFAGAAPPEEVKSESRQASAFAWTANALAVAGVATIGVTLALTLLRSPEPAARAHAPQRKEPPRPQQSIVVGPTGGMFHGTF